MATRNLTQGKMIVHQHFKPIWCINFAPLYLFDNKGNCYHKGNAIKCVLNGGSVGYNVQGKFISRKKLVHFLAKVQSK